MKLCLIKKSTKQSFDNLIISKSPMLKSLVYSSLTYVCNIVSTNVIIFTFFQSNGTIPSSSDKLNTVCYCFHNLLSNSRDLGGIPSTLGLVDLLY